MALSEWTTDRLTYTNYIRINDKSKLTWELTYLANQILPGWCWQSSPNFAFSVWEISSLLRGKQRGIMLTRTEFGQFKMYSIFYMADENAVLL